MIILGVETSCDETSISIIKASKNKIEVLSNVVSSQIELHAKWGGVVPNLAAREHLKNIIPVLEKSLKEASLEKESIDLISVTEGPGLIPALLVGTNFAKTLSYLWEKPLIGIHHIEGHIYANFIGDKIGASSKSRILNSKQITFPLLALVVSGGHTQLILMKNHLQYEIIGETQDDAAGEAFDKVARLLGLGYPGGPAIAAAAANFKFRISNFNQNSKLKVENSLKLPRPMLNSKDFNFSFSGLKTAVLYMVKDYKKKNNLTENEKLPKEFIAEIAHEFQEAAIEVLVSKTIKAAKKYNPKTIVLAGGVSANKELDRKMNEAIKERLPRTTYQKPDTTYSLDNAAMIATSGYYRWENMKNTEREKSLENWKVLQADAGLKLS